MIELHLPEIYPALSSSHGRSFSYLYSAACIALREVSYFFGDGSTVGRWDGATEIGQIQKHLSDGTAPHSWATIGSKTSSAGKGRSILHLVPLPLLLPESQTRNCAWLDLRVISKIRYLSGASLLALNMALAVKATSGKQQCQQSARKGHNLLGIKPRRLTITLVSDHIYRDLKLRT